MRSVPLQVSFPAQATFTGTLPVRWRSVVEATEGPGPSPSPQLGERPWTSLRGVPPDVGTV